ncbi:hypothetical protein RJT34_24846 [Clitoria ternatea]|uniref:Uncharacterized protein n=1 Tax=Clitoria ternatea TaxID=43366 RepID=A0AAN9IGA7_CLITE
MWATGGVTCEDSPTLKLLRAPKDLLPLSLSLSLPLVTCVSLFLSIYHQNSFIKIPIFFFNFQLFTFPITHSSFSKISTLHTSSQNVLAGVWIIALMISGRRE